jgi:hypothetical protein
MDGLARRFVSGESTRSKKKRSFSNSQPNYLAQKSSRDRSIRRLTIIEVMALRKTVDVARKRAKKPPKNQLREMIESNYTCERYPSVEYAIGIIRAHLIREKA